MTAGPPPESRGMTIVDLMALSLGVAGSFAVARASERGGMLPSTSVGILIVLATLAAWAMATSVATVSLMRSIRFGRPVLPGEWLAVLLGAYGFAALNARGFASAELILINLGDWSVDGARRLIAAGWTLMALWLVGMRFALRRWLAPGWLALLDVAAVVVALGGPFAWFAREGPSLMDPSNPFRIDRVWSGRSFGPQHFLRHQILERVSQTPIGLLFAFASAAFLREGWRRVRPWTAWAGVAIAWPVIALYIYGHPTTFPPGSRFWLLDTLFHLAWTAGEWALAWRVLRRLQPTPGGVEPGPVIGAPASTSAT